MLVGHEFAQGGLHIAQELAQALVGPGGIDTWNQRVQLAAIFTSSGVCLSTFRANGIFTTVTDVAKGDLADALLDNLRAELGTL